MSKPIQTNWLISTLLEHRLRKNGRQWKMDSSKFPKECTDFQLRVRLAYISLLEKFFNSSQAAVEETARPILQSADFPQNDELILDQFRSTISEIFVDKANAGRILAALEYAAVLADGFLRQGGDPSFVDRIADCLTDVLDTLKSIHYTPMEMANGFWEFILTTCSHMETETVAAELIIRQLEKKKQG